MSQLVTALPKPGDIFDGQYRIECLLGRGQTSATFGAIRVADGERCAVRCWLALDAGIAAAACREFVRVSNEAGLFAHPAIVEVFSVGEVDSMHYAAMEWLEGMSLPLFLEKHGVLSIDTALKLLVPCVDGLAEAHAAGVVHGDLRLENVFVCGATADEPMRARLMHFGFSGSEGQPLVLPRPLSGNSRRFLSPEELRSDPLDERSDVYAIGVLFYVLLSGRFPFQAENMNDLALEIVAGAWTPLSKHVPKLPLGMVWVVEHAMATEPDERYQSLDELLRDMGRFDLGVQMPQLTSLSPLDHGQSWPPPAAALAVPLYRPSPRDAELLAQARKDDARRIMVSRAGVLIGIVFAALLVRVLTAHERPASRASATKRRQETREQSERNAPTATAPSESEPNGPQERPRVTVRGDRSTGPAAVGGSGHSEEARSGSALAGASGAALAATPGAPAESVQGASATSPLMAAGDSALGPRVSPGSPLAAAPAAPQETSPMAPPAAAPVASAHNAPAAATHVSAPASESPARAAGVPAPAPRKAASETPQLHGAPLTRPSGGASEQPSASDELVGVVDPFAATAPGERSAARDTGAAEPAGVLGDPPGSTPILDRDAPRPASAADAPAARAGGDVAPAPVGAADALETRAARAPAPTSSRRDPAPPARAASAAAPPGPARVETRAPEDRPRPARDPLSSMRLQ